MADSDSGGPRDTYSDELRDEDMTQRDLPVIRQAYEAPPTIEEKLSPFARDPDSGRVQLRSRTPTAPGMPSLASGGFSAPKILSAPEVMPPDGPTAPDGVPMMSSAQIIGGPGTDPGHELSWEGTDPDNDAAGWGDSAEMPTAKFQDPRPVPQPKGQMPDPNMPKIQISKSMEIQVGNLGAADRERVRPTDAPTVEVISPRRRAAMQPTEVALPALSRKKKKREGSDWPLVVGLIGLALLILGLIALVALGVMGQLSF